MKHNEGKGIILRYKSLILYSSVILLVILVIFISAYFKIFVFLYLFLFILMFLSIYFILRIPRVYFWRQKPQVESVIKKFKREKDITGLASSLVVMGTLYGVIKKHQIELDYYLQAFALFDEMHNDEAKSALCQPIASIYEMLNEISLAKHYYELGLGLSKKRNDIELINEYNKLLKEFYEKLGAKETVEVYEREIERLNKIKREIFDTFELKNPCILCDNKGVEVNLGSIPYPLPSYLPESGSVHLDCLRVEIKNHLLPKISSKSYLLFIIIFYMGLFLGSVWYSWTHLWYLFLIPVLIAILIILAFGLRKYFTRSYWIWRWIEKQSKIEKKKENISAN